MKGFLKYFVSSRSCSCKVKKINANSLFLKICHVTGYRDCRMHSKQTHFNINCTKTNFLLQWPSPHYFTINQLSSTQWHTATL